MAEDANSACEQEGRPDAAARRRAIKGSAGVATGAYEPGYLELLRDEWRRPWEEQLAEAESSEQAAAAEVSEEPLDPR